MPVRKLTPAEVKEIFGDGLILFQRFPHRKEEPPPKAPVELEADQKKEKGDGQSPA